MRKSIRLTLLSAAIGTALAVNVVTAPAASAVYRDYRQERLLEEMRQAQIASDAARMKAEHEAAEPKMNVALEVTIQSAGNTISSSGPVASGSSLHLRLTGIRQYIFSTTYGDDRKQVGRFNANLGDDILVTPSITKEGKVLVEVSVTHVEPSKKSSAPWADRAFETTKNNQTFLVESGAPTITRKISMPGQEQGVTITLKADIQ